MKKHRALPFGYIMKNGKCVSLQREVMLVNRIYEMYENGGSLDSITSELQKQCVPYSDVNPEWNKHKVKRILENERYIGLDGFPAIMEEYLYKRVRAIYEEKTKGMQSPSQNPQKHVWTRLECAGCGGSLKRVGGRTKNILLLECKCCKKRLKFDRNTLMTRLLTEMDKETANANKSCVYSPTPDLLRIENEINRGIDKPTDAKHTRHLIVEAAAMRYSLCPDLAEERMPITDSKAAWQQFKDTVETVLMSADEIHIRLKQERK